MNKNTAIEYHFRLSNFEKFIISQYNLTMDDFVDNILQSKLNPYEILSDFCIHLQGLGLHSSSLKNRVTTVKNFLEFNDVDISPRKFKLKVKFPKNIRRIREALDKNDITNILNSCSDIKLKTYVMLLASTGMRAVEALSIRIKDIYFESSPAKITIRGEHTKTKVDRYVFLTRETVEQIKKWIDYKYRKRRICYKDEKTGKSVEEYRIPQKNVNDFLFSVKGPYKKSSHSTNRLKNFYNTIVLQFQKTLDRNDMGSKEEGNGNNIISLENTNNRIRRKITLHSFRRFVKTTISDLGYADYSEWFIGHSGSTYWRKKDNEKAEIFKKIEPYLTFLNIQQLNRQGADLETKIEELQDINQVLREKDKMKEDVIANLSDKLIMLSERLDAVERSTK
ncbi:MAG: tyrosine-type recombinase/integrase [Nitrososphaeraceae archaeon]